MSDDEVRDIVAGQAKIATEVAQLAARFDAHADRAHSATKTLFTFKDEHDGRLRAIETSYLPRSDFKRFEDKLDAKVDKMVDGQDRLKVSVTKLMAIGGAVLFLANAAIGVLSFVAK